MQAYHLKRELDNLLQCLRGNKQEKKRARLQDFGPEEWDNIYQAAARYRVLPVLYSTLRPLSRDLDIPERIWDALRDSYYRTMACNMRTFHELARVLTGFEKENVPVILLKGVHLGEFVYQNPALRPMEDVDLLVKTENLSKAHTILLSSGYTCQEDNPGKCLEHGAPYFIQGVLKIDVHFNITRPPLSERFDVMELWDRAEPVLFQNRQARILSPEDLLLHLAAHTCVHHVFDNGLLPFVDLSRIIEWYHDRINWAVLWTRADDWGLDRSVYVMLGMLWKLLEEPVPDRVRVAMNSDPGLTEALDTAMHVLQEDHCRTVSPFVARLFNRHGRRLKVGPMLKLLFPSREIMFKKEKKQSAKLEFGKYLLYITRLQQVARTHGKTFWHGLCKDPAIVGAMEMQNRKNNLRDWMVRDD